MKPTKLTLIVAVLLLFGGFSQGFAQSKERQELEKRRVALQSQINKINGLLQSNLSKRQTVLTQVNDLDSRIRATENLIKVNNQEANLLTREINTNLNKITKLRKELQQLKDDYARMIRRSYKSKSQQSRVMFLLSSESFLQAYKRLQYMKQYTRYRKEQGQEIKRQAEELRQLNKDLSEQSEAKKKILASNRETQVKLEKDRRQQQELIASIQKKKGAFEKELRTKQQEVSAIDKQIQKLIREAIAAENKKKGSTSKSSFALTPEAKALAANFTANKGKLPWPLKSGVVSMRFGDHPHPIVKTAIVHSDGVRIETNENESVRCVFNGTVFKIQAIKGANKAILVLHGDYITVYNNISKILVEQGDVLTTGQIIGNVGKSTATGRPTLNFLIYKNTQALDPSLWIYKM